MPGAILAGKYRVERILGQGGMGVVVEARHIELDDRVALKFLLPEYASHPEAKERFSREARNAFKIKSEHVARVSDVGVLETGAPYMVMEFLEGRDLSGVLEKTGVLSVQDAIDFVVQGCEAIAEAHSYGIVHRDIKPANFFLTKRPDGSPLVKVLDFGISKSSSPGVDNLTKTTAAMGSALYMSPEQMQQTRSVDHRTDIYALGISLYELLAGKQPYYADTLPQLCAAILTGIPQPIRELRQDVSPELAAVIERAYARDRGQRYQSVAEFVVALAPFAPPRAAPTIERIARMGGVPVPQLAAGSSGVFAAPAVQAGSSGVLSAPGYPQQPPQPQQQYAATAPQMQAQQPPTNPNQIVPGPYQAPHSVRAAATFAQGATAGPMITGQPRSKGGLIAALAIGFVALGVVGTAVVLRAKAPQPQPQPSATAVAPPVSATATTTQTASAPPVDTATKTAEPAKSADVAPPVAPGTTNPRPLPGKHVAPVKTVAPVAPPPTKKADDPFGHP